MSDHISDEAAEAAAKAYFKDQYAGTRRWSKIHADQREVYIELMTTALTAAYPAIREGIAAEVLAPIEVDRLDEIEGCQRAGVFANEDGRWMLDILRAVSTAKEASE